MELFLTTLVAVIGAIVAAVLGAWLWFMFRLRRTMRQYADRDEKIDALLGPVRWRPARIRLVRAPKQIDVLSDSFLKNWGEAKNEGFRHLRDLQDSEGAYGWLIRCAAHPSHRIGLALFEQETYPDAAENSKPPRFVLFSLDQDKTVRALTNADEAPFTNQKLNWSVDQALSLKPAIAQFLKDNNSVANSEITVQLSRAILEQSYATRMDASLTNRPDLSELRREAKAKDPKVSEEFIEAVFDMRASHWTEQVSQAVLDRYRRSDKIDATRWVDIEPMLHVVHGHLSSDDISEMLVETDVEETLLAQAVERGLEGISLYQHVISQFPQSRRPELLAEVPYPVKSLVYLAEPAEPVPESESDPGAQPYLYKAEDVDGGVKSGSVVANSPREARAQLSAMGLGKAELIPMSEGFSEEEKGWLTDSRTADDVAKALRGNIAVTLLRQLWAWVWFWALPAALVVWSLYEGPPFNWVDIAVWVVAGLVAAGLLVFLLPLVLFTQVMKARLWARWRSGLRWLKVLRTINIFGVMNESDMAREQVLLIAGTGAVDEAQRLWDAQRGKLDEGPWLEGASAIFYQAGLFDEHLDAQRRQMEKMPHDETAALDYAMSLARLNRGLEKSQQIVESIDPENLNDVTEMGFHMVRGLLAMRHGALDQAVRHLRSTIEVLRPYKGVPVAAAACTEVEGYIALCMLLAGDADQARTIWNRVSPMLEASPTTQLLVGEFKSAL